VLLKFTCFHFELELRSPTNCIPQLSLSREQSEQVRLRSPPSSVR